MLISLRKFFRDRPMAEAPLPPVAGAGAPPTAGPAAAPMSSPTEQEGLRAQALSGIQVAIKVLEAALLPLGTQSEEGKAVYSCINRLSKIAGPSGGPDMTQAEVKMLAAQTGPEGAGGPKPPMPGAGGGGGMPMMGPAPRPM